MSDMSIVRLKAACFELREGRGVVGLIHRHSARSWTATPTSLAAERGATPVFSSMEKAVRFLVGPDYRPDEDSSLSPVIWRGEQWAVTSFGIERVEGWKYYLAAADLDDGMGTHSLLDHMAEKNWVWMGDFCEAWAEAMSVHRPDISKKKVRAEIDRWMGREAAE